MDCESPARNGRRASKRTRELIPVRFRRQNDCGIPAVPLQAVDSNFCFLALGTQPNSVCALGVWKPDLKTAGWGIPIRNSGAEGKLRLELNDSRLESTLRNRVCARISRKHTDRGRRGRSGGGFRPARRPESGTAASQGEWTNLGKKGRVVVHFAPIWSRFSAHRSISS